MRAGDLRHQISLQALTDGLEAPLPSGAPDQYWDDIATLTNIRASIEPLSGRELYAAQQFNSEVTHSVHIRYRAGITDAMRVRFGTRLFTIHNVLNIEERNRDIQLLCSEGLALAT